MWESDPRLQNALMLVLMMQLAAPFLSWLDCGGSQLGLSQTHFQNAKLFRPKRVQPAVCACGGDGRLMAFNVQTFCFIQ